MSAIVIQGGLIHYEAFGRGKPVLFVHGWLGSWRYWMSAMEELSTTHRTYALDLWGFGDSDKLKRRYTACSYVDLLQAFMDELGIGRVLLVGHSLGAVVSVRFAAENADRVDRLMLVSPPVSGASINRELCSFGTSNTLFGRLLWRKPVDYEQVLEEAKKTDGEAITASMESVAEIDIRKYTDSLQIPCLVVYGEKDNIITPPKPEDFNRYRSNVRPIALAKSRHFPMLDEAGKFNRLLKDFLEVEDLASLELKKEWRRRTR